MTSKFWDEFSIYFSASLIIDSDHKFVCFLNIFFSQRNFVVLGPGHQMRAGKQRKSERDKVYRLEHENGIQHRLELRWK